MTMFWIVMAAAAGACISVQGAVNSSLRVHLQDARWWNWIGGALGAVIVFAGATLTPKLGAASFIAAVVGGQILCSLCLDHFGLLDLPLHAVNLNRVLGAGLVVAGVIVVTRN